MMLQEETFQLSVKHKESIWKYALKLKEIITLDDITEIRDYAISWEAHN